MLSPVDLAFYVSWAVTGLGVALWVWSWIQVKEPIAKLRFRDCGVVLVMAAVLTRIMIQTRTLSVMDWVIILLGPLFIAVCLWRLSRTQGLKS